MSSAARAGHPAVRIRKIYPDRIVRHKRHGADPSATIVAVMAVPRKGWRKLVVRGRTYYWHTRGTDEGVKVTVATDEAFGRGAGGQLLHLHVDYGSGRLAITPAVVAAAIERSLDGPDPLLGDAGGADVVLERVRR